MFRASDAGHRRRREGARSELNLRERWGLQSWVGLKSFDELQANEKHLSCWFVATSP